MKKLLRKTQSVCPVCLKVLPAYYLARGETVFMEKTCAQHGHFATPVWRGVVHFQNWWQKKKPDKPEFTQTVGDHHCPYDCGLCTDHRQRSCCVLLEITPNCDLGCPICYAGSTVGQSPEPSLEQITQWLHFLYEQAGPVNVQLSGGEPSMHTELLEIVRKVKEIGFPFVQLNTNGLRLAKEPQLAKDLVAAGLDAVYLQFDGLDDESYRLLRGRPLLKEKLQCIENCQKAYLGVVLVPTIKGDWNKNQIGPIIRFALDHLPYIRGVHFQPMSFFGRYPQAPKEKERFLLTDLMDEIEKQTAGLIQKGSFTPSGCEHNACSFHGSYLLQKDGTVKANRKTEEDCCCCTAPKKGEAVEKAKKFVANRWQMPLEAVLAYEKGELEDISNMESFLLYGKAFRFIITAMAFQDCWNLDLERLKSCCVHIVAQDGKKIIPFCAKNLTSLDGLKIYD